MRPSSELDQYDTGNAPGCSRALKTCAVVALVLVALCIGAIIWVLRTPAVRGVLTCRANMVEVGQALERYHKVNAEYPSDLRSLEKEYLSDTSVLRCPLDKSRPDGPSCRYNRPGPHAKDDFVILQCDRHSLKPDTPATALTLRKDGTFEAKTPNQ